MLQYFIKWCNILVLQTDVSKSVEVQFPMLPEIEMPKSNFPRWHMLTVVRHQRSTSLQSTLHPPPPWKHLCSFSTPGRRRTRCACNYLLFNSIYWPQQNLHDEERHLSLRCVAASSPSTPSLTQKVRVWRIGVRVLSWWPLKNPYPCQGFQGFFYYAF